MKILVMPYWNKMGILGIDLNNIDSDDTNYDEHNILDLKNRKHLKET